MRLFDTYPIQNWRAVKYLKIACFVQMWLIYATFSSANILNCRISLKPQNKFFILFLTRKWRFLHVYFCQKFQACLKLCGLLFFINLCLNIKVIKEEMLCVHKFIKYLFGFLISNIFHYKYNKLGLKYSIINFF